MTADPGTPVPRTALAHAAGAFAAAGGSGDLLLTEVPFLTQVAVQLRDDDGTAAAALAGELGAAVPGGVGAVTGIPDGGHVLGLGPGEWLVTSPTEPGPDLVQRLRGRAAGRVVSVVDVSAQRVAVVVAGRHARDVLEQGVPLDLGDRALPPGRCAQTLLARTPVVLHRLPDVDGAGEGPAYRLLVRSSYAGYAAAWLVDAATEYA